MTAQEAVAANPAWYHTIELAPGVVTPGQIDHRTVVDRVLPKDLSGRRALDVGTFDGFWAFELERRGAAEVVAVDVLDPYQWDWPVDSSRETIAAVAKRKGEGDGFLIAHEALGSEVTRVEGSVYELPDLGIGTFDFVYVGSLLLHLRDPVRALQAVRAVCDGEMLIVDAIDLPLTIAHRNHPVARLDGVGRPWWWKPNVAALRRMVEDAGFEVAHAPVQVYMPPGRGQPLPRLSPRHLLSAAGRELLVLKRRGDPHAAVSGRPTGTGTVPTGA